METKNSSFNRILKTTGISGSSQFITLLVGFVRVKVVAVLLGTAGVGLVGVYQSVIDMVKAFSGLGLDLGSIRDIARADADANQEQTAYTVSIFKRLFLLAALVGAAICLIFCVPISRAAFGTTDYSLQIGALSLSVFFFSIATGRQVILRGLRKITFLAKAAVLESVITMFVLVPAYYFLGADGIIPVFIGSALIFFLCLNYYYRKLSLKAISVSNKEVLKTAVDTLRLGVFVVLAGIVSTGSMFLMRAYITNEAGLDSAGLFQSAWAITIVYTSLILGSTGSDIYPRLSAIANDATEVKKLVNEHLYIVSIIATPIVTAMCLVPDLVLTILYSGKFTAAKDILVWQVAGSFFKIISTPMAYILLTRNKGVMYLVSEVAFYVVYLLFGYLALPHLGIAGVGVGYLAAYAVYMLIIFAMCRRVSGFGWNTEVAFMIGFGMSLMVAALVVINVLSGVWMLVAGAGLFVISVLFSLSKLLKIVSLSDLKSWFANRNKRQE